MASNMAVIRSMSPYGGVTMMGLENRAPPLTAYWVRAVYCGVE